MKRIQRPFIPNTHCNAWYLSKGKGTIMQILFIILPHYTVKLKLLIHWSVNPIFCFVWLIPQWNFWSTNQPEAWPFLSQRRSLWQEETHSAGGSWPGQLQLTGTWVSPGALPFTLHCQSCVAPSWSLPGESPPVPWEEERAGVISSFISHLWEGLAVLPHSSCAASSPSCETPWCF